LLTAATCTKYELAGRVVEGSGVLLVGLTDDGFAEDGLAADALAPELPAAPPFEELLESPGVTVFASAAAAPGSGVALFCSTGFEALAGADIVLLAGFITPGVVVSDTAEETAGSDLLPSLYPREKLPAQIATSTKKRTRSFPVPRVISVSSDEAIDEVMVQLHEVKLHEL
jgi:hypothetical protein